MKTASCLIEARHQTVSYVALRTFMQIDPTLEDWNAISFQAMTRSGKTATEWLWFNYPEPVALHDYGFLGDDYRERERIKRKKQRWVARLQSMPLLERRALLSAIDAAWPQLAPSELMVLADTAIDDDTGI